MYESCNLFLYCHRSSIKSIVPTKFKWLSTSSNSCSLPNHPELEYEHCGFVVLPRTIGIHSAFIISCSMTRFSSVSHQQHEAAPSQIYADEVFLVRTRYWSEGEPVSHQTRTSLILYQIGANPTSNEWLCTVGHFESCETGESGRLVFPLYFVPFYLYVSTQSKKLLRTEREQQPSQAHCDFDFS